MLCIYAFLSCIGGLALSGFLGMGAFAVFDLLLSLDYLKKYKETKVEKEYRSVCLIF